MKIQEMKSGISHFSKKMENKTREDIFVPRPLSGATLPVESELETRSWSVVSFDKREAGGLTYEGAVEVMTELDSLGVSGLCIVTDKAGRLVKA